jgi:alkylation response protein AidB-like acyl-CoA dehydrogenase
MDTLPRTETSAAQAQQLVQKAGALVPILRQRAEATSKARRIPPETVDDLWRSGTFATLRPKRFGGLELRYTDFLDLSSELGRGDGSAAWFFSVVGVHELMVALYPEEVQAEVWSNPRNLVASAFLPGSQPVKEKDGYRVSGKWSFCSGVDNAQWIVLGGMFGMIGDPPRPDLRFMLMPISDCKIIDDWHVSGLRGTGSKSVVVENTFLPDNRVLASDVLERGEAPGTRIHAGAIYRAPLYSIFPFCLSAPATGIARGAFEQFIEKLKNKTGFDPFGMPKQRHWPVRISEASALIDAAELLYRRSADETIAKVERGEPLSLEHRLRSRRDQAYSVVMVTRALELLVKSGGGHGLYDSDPVRRAYNDLQAMSSHVAVTWDLPSVHYGNHLLGQPPTDTLW